MWWDIYNKYYCLLNYLIHLIGKLPTFDWVGHNSKWANGQAKALACLWHGPNIDGMKAVSEHLQNGKSCGVSQYDLVITKVVQVRTTGELASGSWHINECRERMFTLLVWSHRGANVAQISVKRNTTMIKKSVNRS